MELLQEYLLPVSSSGWLINGKQELLWRKVSRMVSALEHKQHLRGGRLPVHRLLTLLCLDHLD